ncbi:MAG TPA: hypothetical protein VLG37_04720 [Candidatus Saccharimonadales bacterium]|nr:hypothetical protein [Candidatus Saccharimonadales bacterium]
MTNIVKGFEYLDDDGPLKSTLEQGLGEALVLLAGVEPAGELSLPAFTWGMRGRQVSQEAASLAVRCLRQKGLVEFDGIYPIKYNPFTIKEAAQDWANRSGDRGFTVESWDPIGSARAVRMLAVRDLFD